MDRDARKMRGERHFVFARVKVRMGVKEIAAFIVVVGGLRLAA
jgi:urease accessory protein